MTRRFWRFWPMKWRVDHPKGFKRAFGFQFCNYPNSVRYVKYIESTYILLLTTFMYIQIVNIHGTSIHCKAVQPISKLLLRHSLEGQNLDHTCRGLAWFKGKFIGTPIFHWKNHGLRFRFSLQRPRTNPMLHRIVENQANLKHMKRGYCISFQMETGSGTKNEVFEHHSNHCCYLRWDRRVVCNTMILTAMLVHTCRSLSSHGNISLELPLGIQLQKWLKTLQVFENMRDHEGMTFN